MYLPFSICIDGIDAFIRSIFKKKHEEQQHGSLNGGSHVSSLGNYDFTILIPSYNASKHLSKTLENLEEYKDKVLIVDDASKDDTSRIALERGYRVLKNPMNGKKVGAIAKGLEEVDSTYTVLIDSDTCILEGKIEELVGLMEIEKLDGCAVKVMPSTRNGLLENLQRIEYAKAMSLGRGSMGGTGKPLVPCISGAFGIFRTDVLKKITQEQLHNGSFWEGEDFERTLRIIERGGRVSCCNEIEVVTDIPITLRDFTKQRITWQCGYLRCHWSFKKMLLRKDKLGFSFIFNYIFNIIGHPFKLFSIVPLLMISRIETLLIFYGVYLILETILARISLTEEEWKQSRKYIPLIPLYGLYQLLVPTTIGYLKIIVTVDARKKFRLAKCPKCKRLTPYKTWRKDSETNKWISLKLDTIKCRRCGTSNPIRREK